MLIAPPDHSWFHDLPPAQRDVAAGLLQGRTLRQIAASRGTTATTIAKQAQSIYRRVGVGGRRELSAHTGTTPDHESPPTPATPPLTQSPPAIDGLKLPAAAELLSSGHRRRSPSRCDLQHIDGPTLWAALVDGRWSIIDADVTHIPTCFAARPNPRSQRADKRLTPRERHIVGWAARGQSGKLVAYELGLTPSAVSHHLKRSLQKLGLASVEALIALHRIVGA